MAKKIINVGQAANDRKGDSLRAAFGKVNENFTELYTALGLNSGGLNIGAFEFSGSTMSTTDSSTIVIDQATTVTSNLTVGGDILPSTANGGDLGSPTRPFRSLYVSNNTFHIGNVPIRLDASNRLVINNAPLTLNADSIPSELNVDINRQAPLHIDSNMYIDINAYNGLIDINALGGELSLLSTEQINVRAGSAIWNFTDSASLQLPNNSSILHNGISIGAEGIDTSIYLPNNAESHLYGGVLITNRDGAVTIETGDPVNEFIFTADGNLKIPGHIGSETDINIDINLEDSTLRRWTFGEDGDLTFPNGTTIEVEYGGAPRTVIDSQHLHLELRSEGIVMVGFNSNGNVYIGNPNDTPNYTTFWSSNVQFSGQTVPASSIGAAGDVFGQIAFDQNYIYYCKQSYNGSSNIWKRLAWSGDTW